MKTVDTAKPLDDEFPGGARVLPFGLFAYVGAGASMLVCYGKTMLLASLGILGLNIPDINPHAQAVLMWVLGMVAVYGLLQDRKVHHKNHPVLLGALGVTVIILTLYAHYSSAIELSGYILLLTAAFLNQNVFLVQLSRQVGEQAREVKELNQDLEERVQVQVGEIERLNRLKRFLAPEVARLVTEEQEKSLLQSHRTYIAALFCDLRGFTSFSASMEPEEVMGVLQTYHNELGKLVAEAGGTIDHRAGDGLMVFFNDPLPCDEPVLKAVQLALDMRKQFSDLNLKWKKYGYELGFGVGIGGGYATLGVVGFEGRFDYTANGNAVNLAARLCDDAQDGQILIDHKAFVEVEEKINTEPIGNLTLKGFTGKIRAHNVLDLRL